MDFHREMTNLIRYLLFVDETEADTDWQTIGNYGVIRGIARVAIHIYLWPW